MASEIRVNKINSSTGVGTITLSPTGVDISGITTVSTLKVGTGVTASEDGDIFFTGVCTATTFAGAHSGSGANLTSLPAAQLTGALPAISGANLTGIAATDNVRTGILDVAGIATFRNDVNIGAAVTISESGIEASGIGITCANINGTQIGGRRNIIINGAMEVAQRGTSSTSAGYQTVDRFTTSMAGTDEACTFAQVDVASGTTPYTEGFRKAFKVTNGNQTSGAGAADDLSVSQNIESQNLAQSGWDYTSSSSFITLSFWVKSSVAQTFFAGIRLYGDDQREFCFSYTLTADTWTKVVKSIPGAAGLTIVNSNAIGAFIQWPQWWGTNYTSSGRSVDTWQVKNNASNFPDNTTTWYTTNDATWELTGVQLEVGSQATPFEHRSYGEELELCKRYFLKWNRSGSNRYTYAGGYTSHATSAFIDVTFNPEMRAAPTVGSFSDANVTGASWPTLNPECAIYIGSATQSGAAAIIQSAVDFSAEL